MPKRITDILNNANGIRKACHRVRITHLTSLASGPSPPPVHIGITIVAEEAAEITIDARGFTVKQVARPNHVTKGGSLFRLLHLQEYGAKVPQWLHEAVSTFGGPLGRRTIAATTLWEHDLASLTPMQIGTPRESVYVP